MRNRSKLASSLVALGVITLMAGAPLPAQSAGVCGPLDDGRVANVFYEGTLVFFEPIVEYAWDRAVLTISGPCEDIVRAFKRGEEISFDIAEIVRVTDGQYTWQLRFEPTIDPGVQEDLLASRGTGEEDAVWWSYWQKGAIPAGASVDSASFSVVRGLIVDPNSGEEKSASLGAKGRTASVAAAAAAGIAGSGSEASGEGDGPVLGAKDQVIPDDLIVQGSACVGFDCVNGESFGFDTIRLKENNTRIQFNDTSSSASYPTNNWQIRANSSSNGGANFLGFVDQNASDTSETGTLVFAVEADAGANALYVDSTSRVGLGTATPVLDLHISSTNTPGLRLEQTSGGGFTAQTWDLAGNEANFFVRDVTGGSRLPFRIRPGAPTSSIDIAADGDVGIGTASPGADGLEIVRTGSAAQRIMFRLDNNGAPQSEFEDTSNGILWRFGMNSSGDFVINDTADLGTAEMRIETDGDVFVNGTMVHTSSRSMKENFTPANPADVLARVTALPISVWNLKKDDASVRHIGPTSEDFHAAFGLGDDRRFIADGDTAGVALVAIQGLSELVEEKDREIEELASQVQELAARVQELSEDR